MTKKQKIGTIIGCSLGAVAIVTGSIVTAIVLSQKPNNNITITSAMSQAIYDDIVSDIPTGKISIEDLNSPSNINKLKRKIASILDIPVTNITDINFSNASSSNMANVTIRFDENFKFNIDDNDLCFKQNKNTITSKKPFLYGHPPYHISVDIENKFNTKITEYLENQKDPVHNGVYLDQINSSTNISSLISELNTILSQNKRTIEVVSILFSINDASTNSGVYATISFDGKIRIDEPSSYIQDQNSNTLTSRQPFLVNVIGSGVTSNYLNLIDISAISKALGTYGNNVQEIVNHFASNNNSLKEFVSSYFPIENKEINASLDLAPNNNEAVQLTIYFVGTFDFIKLTIYPSFGNKIVNDYFVINGGVLVGLTELGKQQTSLDLNGLNINQIGNNAFKYCSTLTSITIPNSVTLIGDNAFSGCRTLTSINIPNSVASIGNDAFSGCNALSSVTFQPNSRLTSIGRYAFTSFIQIDLNNCSLINQENFTNISFNNPNPTFIKDNCSINVNNILNLSELTVESNYYNQSTNTLTIPSNIIKIIGQISSELSYSLIRIEFQENGQLTSIGDRAFEDCRTLRLINIPSSVTSIGSNAFYGCSALTTIDIPSSVTSIGDGAFKCCSALSSITIPSSVTTIKSNAFSGCTSLNSVTFQGNSQLTSIGENAFFGCNLTTIDLNSCIFLTINQYVNICTNNRTIKFIHTKYDSQIFNLSNSNIDSGNTTLTIPVDARYLIGNAPSNITTVNFNGNTKIKTIPKYAFSGCSSLNTVTLNEGIQSIEDYAFSRCSSLTSINIPSSVTSIGNRSFESCSSLTSINIPSSVTTIESNAFSGCTTLSSVRFQENSQLTSIGDYAFASCRVLRLINIPSSVTTIESNAFSGCGSLTSITIPSSVTSIGYGAFSDCSSLYSVIFKGNSQLQMIGENAFFGYNLTTIDLNSCIFLTINQYVNICTNNRTIKFIHNFYDSQIFNLRNDQLTNTTLTIPNNTKYLIGRAPSNITSIDFGENTKIKTIPKDAFNGCSSLTSINIPSSVTTIESNAFSGCTTLSSVRFQENSQLTSIGERAFDLCSSLSSINIPNSVTSIGNSAFVRCNLLNSVTFKSNSKLQMIGNNAFKGLCLTSINIPSSVTSIGDSAFSGCQSLNSVIFQENSQLQMIGGNAFSGCSALTSIDLSNCTLITPVKQIIITLNNPNIKFTFSNNKNKSSIKTFLL